MSRDIFVQDLPSEAKSGGYLSSFRPLLIGKRSEIIDGIIGVIPTADFFDSSWGLIDGQDWSIEVDLGQDETAAASPFTSALETTPLVLSQQSFGG